MNPSTTLREEVANETLVLPVTGMSCSACQVHVQKSLAQASGVSSADVSLMSHSARVVYNPRMIAPQAIVEVIRESGYDASLPSPEEQAHAGPEASAETSALRYRAWITLAMGMVAMVASMPLMHSHSAIDSLFMQAAPWLYALPQAPLRYGLLGITLAGMAWGAPSVYRRAWTAARHRSTNMNTLVALGTGAAFLYSAAATIAPGFFLRFGLAPDVYFESVLLILGFLLLGDWLNTRARHRTLDALRGFAQLQPKTARIRKGGVETEVALAHVLPEDEVAVRPGERIPVDGIVVAGSTTVDESMITGESEPVLRGPGDRVIGGSLNFEGAFTYRATSIGADSVLGQMLALMEEAQASRAPLQKLADSVSSVFVPIVLLLALLTFVAWATAGSLMHLPGSGTRAFAIAISVLVIACPCAMGLAVPAALTVAIGRGAQLGLLFKGGESLERLAHVDTVVLDKTGTLTEGRPRIVAVHAATGTSEEALLRIAASLEQGSEHPLAHAVLDAAGSRGISPSPASDIRALPGRGISGMIDGKIVLAGTLSLMREQNVPLPDPLPASPHSTLLCISIAGRFAGFLEAHDSLRATAADLVATLTRSGIDVQMLTGDRRAAAETIATEAGIRTVYAELLPAGKVEEVRRLQQSGRHVAMVGDGINDAAALAQADAGIAVGTGTDLAREAGDVILLRAEPRSVAVAINLARRTVRVMRENLAWALIYNLIGIPIAAGILYPHFHLLLSPAIASAAMALSSVSVLANSLRLKRFTS